MLTEVIWDLKYFMLLYLMMVCTFSTTTIILNQYFMTLNYHGSEKEYQEMFEQSTSNTFFDAFINQWILGLGEFDPSPFKTNSGEFSGDVQWYLFIGATFVTNIVFLNMLIAIMQNTFDKITEKKERNGLVQQTSLYADFIYQLKIDEKINKKRFLYIIAPISGEE